MVKVESECRFAFHKFECRFVFHKSNRTIGYFRVGLKSTEMENAKKRKSEKTKNRKNGKKLAAREIARYSNEQRENILTKHNKARSDDDDNGRCWFPFVFLFAVVAVAHVQWYGCVCTDEKRTVVKFHCRSCCSHQERNVFFNATTRLSCSCVSCHDDNHCFCYSGRTTGRIWTGVVQINHT